MALPAQESRQNFRRNYSPLGTELSSDCLINRNRLFYEKSAIVVAARSKTEVPNPDILRDRAFADLFACISSHARFDDTTDRLRTSPRTYCIRRMYGHNREMKFASLRDMLENFYDIT